MPAKVWDKLYPISAYSDSSGEYITVPDDEKKNAGSAGDEDSLYIISHSSRRRSISQCFPSFTQILILALSISLVTFVGLYISLQLKLRPQNRLDCGRTIEEAHAKGCIFDTLSKAWLPSACPFYGLDEYMAAGIAASNNTDKPWPFYRDKEHTQEISIREMSHMAAARKADIQEFQTSNREHVTHCAWMLVRMAHAYKFAERRDLNVDSFEHNKHCALFLLSRSLEAPGNDDIAVRGNVIFGGC